MNAEQRTKLLKVVKGIGADSANAPSGNDGQTSRRLLPHRPRMRSALRSYDEDITGSKYPGHIRLQEIGVAIDGPVVLI